MKIKRSADRDQHGRPEQRAMACHPIVLLGRADAHPDDVRGRRVDGLEDIPILLAVGRPERRRVGSRDDESRISSLQPAREQIGRAGHASVKEVPVSGALRAVAEREHQVRPVHPPRIPIPMQLTQPDKRHPVRRGQPTRIHDAAQALVVLALHDGVHGADVDVLRISARDPLGNLFDRLLKVDGTYADTQYVDAGGTHPGVTTLADMVGNLISETVPVPVKVAEPDSPRPLSLAGLPDGRHTGRVARIAVLCVSDLSALIIATVSAYLLWALPARGQSVALYLQLAPLVSLFVLGYAQAGLYPGFGLGPVETLRRLSYVTAFGYLVLAAFSFALRLPPLYSRVTFLLSFAFSLLMVPVVRLVVSRLARRWPWWSEPVVVVGTGDRAARAIRSILTSGQFGYRPAAVLAIESSIDSRIRDIEGVPVAGGLEQAPSLARRGMRVALLESRRADPSRERTMIDRLQRDFRHVVLIREYDDLPVEGLQIRNLGNLVGIEYTNNLLVHGNQVLKRVLDLTLAGCAAIVFAPVVLCAAALVRLIDGGPAFFVQERAGLDGRRIQVPKIRTMRRDAEKRLNEYLAANPGLREEWEARYKLTNDPRLIPIVGRLFRRFSIDELPQLWSVVRGDMSLVGPRPFPDYHMNRFSPAFLELRRRVRPGITGLWQITVRSAGGPAEQESYDSYYIRNWSAWLDLYVLSRTIAAVASGRGAY
jgi:Undecaprenyl-phosphate galactose phosphotransferase WbaP